MSIMLTMSLLPNKADRLEGFTHFWLRYVRGFSPHFHCQKSLRGTNDPRFNKTMALGTSYKLPEPGTYRYIYLCGVTSHGYPGLHLALMPEKGAHAVAVTYNGIEILVAGARQLEIPHFPDGYAGLSRKYTSCRNWQFGVTYFGMEHFRSELARE